jgi:hypothetical protein
VFENLEKQKKPSDAGNSSIVSIFLSNAFKKALLYTVQKFTPP